MVPDFSSLILFFMPVQLNSPAKLLLLLIALFPLAGCPVPAYYYFVDSKEYEPPTDHCDIKVSNFHPWRDTKKKTITVIATITNTSSTEKLSFPLSQAVLTGKTDSFFLNYTNKELVNGLLMTEDTVVIEPGMEKKVTLYFLGNKDYSHNKYYRSIKTDTLLLKLNGKEIRLAGKRTSPTIF